jgi:putative pyruvate formate lyase activating enzyme
MEPLRRYWSILKGGEMPAYLKAKARRLDFTSRMSDRQLWSIHDDALHSQNGIGKGKTDLLSLKLLLAERMMKNCELCENRCGVDRSRGEKGECGLGPAKVASMFLHHGEEEPLVPSFTVFFSGCNFECAFCQNFDISTDPDAGREVPPDSLARRIENLTDIGRAGFHVSLVREWGERARNVNWVGGEPTPNLEFVLRVLQECRANIPQIWNSNMYMSESCIRLLHGIVDLYLSDFKYGNDRCAKRLSGIDAYFEIVSRNHLLAAKHADMLVRHLMLPGHQECCTKPILHWLAENLPGVLVNVMDQYRPMHRAESYPELRGVVPRKDYEEAVALAKKLKLNLV